MKQLMSIIAAVSLLIGCSSDFDYTPQCNDKIREHHESASLENESFKILKIHGDLHLLDSEGIEAEVSGSFTSRRTNIKKLTVMGTANIKDSHFGKVLIHGPTQLWNVDIEHHFESFGNLKVEDNSFFKGPVLVHGELCATNVVFEKIVCADGLVNVLSNVKGKTLRILNNRKQPQLVILENSRFDRIEFESGNGVIEVRSPSYIGQVSGGRIQYRS